ncbi:MAG: hypothetical protein Q7S00_08070, partial [bacterium]|nr:hypothetical protein [bacterium]
MRKNILRILGAAILIVTGGGSNDNSKNQEGPQADPGLYDGALTQEVQPKPDKSPDSDDSKEDPQECDDCGPCGILGGCEEEVPLPEISQCTITTVAGDGGRGAWYTDENEVPATEASLYFTNTGPGLAVDPSGGLFFAELRRVRHITTSGILQTVAGGNLDFTALGDGGPAVSATVDPYRMVTDSNGNLYFGECATGRVRKVSADGTISTIAGGGTLIGIDGIPATTASLTCPTAVALDRNGNIYINDEFLISGYWHSKVRKISTGGIITTVAGQASRTGHYLGDGGPAISAGILVKDLAVDSLGNIYIANERRVRKISPDGIITTFAGSDPSFTGALGDHGPATEAALRNATGVAVDSNDNIYIADATDSRIRKVTPDGIIVTVAGNGTAGFSGDAGPSLEAQFNAPIDIDVDSEGHVYVVDRDNYRIRKIDCSESEIQGVDLTIVEARLITRGSRSDTLQVTLKNDGNVAADGPFGLAVNPDWYAKPGFN